jgi:hypothetical protein
VRVIDKALTLADGGLQVSYYVRLGNNAMYKLLFNKRLRFSDIMTQFPGTMHKRPQE